MITKTTYNTIYMYQRLVAEGHLEGNTNMEVVADITTKALKLYKEDTKKIWTDIANRVHTHHGTINDLFLI